MRFRVVFVIVLAFCAVVIGACVFGQKSALVLEETSIVALPKPRIVKKPVLIAQQREERVEEAEETVVRVVEATMCTTTPKQQEDLRSLGFHPCSTAQIGVR